MAAATPVLGGITTIPGFENSLEIEGLARFAVEEYNKKQNALVLELKKVLDAKQQVVAGLMYYLKLEVVDRGENKNKVYEAKVWVKPGNSKELEEFRPVSDA
ncbi:unnamed protein product [Fraxinus pennsylvanica]|uniref:Cysteine proteinase inhibitor n=1 Tax=Fraxinus pennsylvanica TaxID=56036 RepID=A0AAD2A555_9LAMI|nr:unnamed protein product [Fraxinus pennsylvanica]